MYGNRPMDRLEIGVSLGGDDLPGSRLMNSFCSNSLFLCSKSLRDSENYEGSHQCQLEIRYVNIFWQPFWPCY
jgi:hypothetical protein